ncbi:O-acetyl-ADP-ribose deacetylase (regulator of RNase III), contains Macro domain [Eubacterium ruminantium]|nr:O-acetyl-ADP-ribose deacetylase (regulator of RNase III), contains Macro domain [Eubacterium ruminantium]
MIRYITGNLFNSDADCIVNTVNCEGYMGKGIAYQFKLRFPENNKKYVEYCKAGKLCPGKLLTYKEKGKIIVNFPTKDKWRNPSLMEYIIDGLDEFVRIIPELNIRKIAMPPLGCGNGGLNWEEVKNVIEDKFKDYNIEVELYEPMAGKYKLVQNEQMTVYDLLLLRVRGKLDNVSSLRFQKTFFFANYYGGVNLFSFARGRYGPYSKELYKAAVRIGDYQKSNGLTSSEETYSAIYQVICSKKVDSQLYKLNKVVDKALDLVNGIENDKLLEGTATALYLIRDERMVDKVEILRAFREWSEDKAERFKEAVIEECLDKLEQLGIVQRNLFDRYVVNYSIS